MDRHASPDVVEYPLLYGGLSRIACIIVSHNRGLERFFRFSGNFFHAEWSQGLESFFNVAT